MEVHSKRGDQSTWWDSGLQAGRVGRRSFDEGDAGGGIGVRCGMGRDSLWQGSQGEQASYKGSIKKAKWTI